MITGAVIAIAGIVVKEISVDWLNDKSKLIFLKDMIFYLRDINGQEYWGIGMAASSISYIIVSLFGEKTEHNMDKLLNRGKYEIDGEVTIVNKEPERGWKVLGMGEEFTWNDKLIFIANYTWTGIWTLVFIIGTIYNLYNPVSDKSWMSFWRSYMFIYIFVSIITIIWFTIGGFNDLKIMMSKLRSDKRDHSDDGWVSNS